ACADAINVLADNPRDIPFAAVYTIDAHGASAIRCAATGLTADSEALPSVLTADGSDRAWPIGALVRSGESAVVDLRATGHSLTGREWPDPVTHAVLVPIQGPAPEHPAGILVAGVSPRRPLDRDYRTFFSLVAAHMATAIVDARIHALDQRRAH